VTGVETIARLSVLLSCAVAAGLLAVILADRRLAGLLARHERPGTLRGVVQAALGGYALVAGGAALTGAGTVDAGMLATGLRVVGVALLVAVAALTVFVMVLPAERIPITAGALVILLWAGGALALVSWLLALGGVLVALVGGVRIEPHR
jgi:hypothetical protein